MSGTREGLLGRPHTAQLGKTTSRRGQGKQGSYTHTTDFLPRRITTVARTGRRTEQASDRVGIKTSCRV